MKAKKKYTEKFVGITPKDYEELEDWHKKVLEIFSRYKFERILDVGCGDGNFSVLLKEACKAKEVYGIEISEKGAKLARKNGVKCYQLDVDEEDFPFEDNYFDAVTAFDIIEHLFDPDHFLEEVYRVLKPKGVFVMSTMNLASLYDRFFILFGFQPSLIGVSLIHPVGHMFKGMKAAPDHIRPFVFRSLKQLLEIHKFEIQIKGRRIANPPEIPFLSFFLLIDKFLSLFPSLSSGFIVLARRHP